MKKLLLFIFILCSQFVIAQRVLKGVASNPSTEYQAILVNASSLNKPNYTGFLPTTTEQKNQDAFIQALKSAGIWSLTDVLKVYATNGAPLFSLINWKNPGVFNSNFGASGVFISDGGYYFNFSAFIDEGWAPSSLTNFTQNSCESICYYDNLVSQIGGVNGGVDGVRNGADFSRDAAFNPLYITPANTVLVSMNSGTPNTLTNVQFDGTKGLYFWGRTSSSSEFAKKDGGSRSTLSATSASPITAYNFTLGGFNVAGSITNPANRQCLLHWVGGLLTTTQETQFKTAWDTYYATLIAPPAPVIRGDIYNVSSWANLSAFTNVGATASVVSNAINFSGGASNFLQTLQLNSPLTSGDHWKITGLFKATQIGVSGFGLGLKSVSTIASKFDVAVQCSVNGVNSGKLFLTTNSNGTFTTRATSAAALTISLNDIIQITIQRELNVITVTGFNTTAGGITNTAFYAYPGQGGATIPNICKYSVYSVGGTFTLTSLHVESSAAKNLKFLCMGDSKTSSYYADEYNNCWPGILASYGYHVNRCAGGSEVTGDYILRTQEIIDLAPTAVIIGGASNDPRDGVTSATTNANYDTFVSALTSAGIRVIHTTGFYESAGLNQTPLRTHILATYAAGDIIDTLPTVITLNADGVHPDTNGHIQIVNMLVTSGKL